MRLKMADGSVQQINELPDDLKLIYRTVWEIPMRGLIDMARERNAYIDQSQSLNLFSESPEYRQAQLHVHVCVEERSQNDILHAVTSSDAHRQDHSRP